MKQPTAPTSFQTQIVAKLLSRDFPGRDELQKQFLSAKTQDDECECKCPSFTILPDSSAPKAPSKIRIPVEAQTNDTDENNVDILLHVIDGYLAEVEFVKYDDSDFIGPIDPEVIVIKVNDPKDG
jgi:hypothetical protein